MATPSPALWVNKYAPKTFRDAVGNTEMLNALQQYRHDPASMPSMILAGPPGCGKTTSMHILAHVLHGSLKDDSCLELNASDQRGLDVVRKDIVDFVRRHVPGRKHYKIVILDEFDSMTTEAQEALRKVMEENSDRARFAFACNHPNKILEAIISRCSVLKFNKIEPREMLLRLIHVCEQEGLGYDAPGLDALIFLADGDMRKALTRLQALAEHAGGSGDHAQKGSAGVDDAGRASTGAAPAAPPGAVSSRKDAAKDAEEPKDEPSCLEEESPVDAASPEKAAVMQSGSGLPGVVQESAAVPVDASSASAAPAAKASAAGGAEAPAAGDDPDATAAQRKSYSGQPLDSDVPPRQPDCPADASLPLVVTRENVLMTSESPDPDVIRACINNALYGRDWTLAFFPLSKMLRNGFQMTDLLYWMRRVVLYSMDELDERIRADVLQELAETHGKMVLANCYTEMQMDALMMRLRLKYNVMEKVGVMGMVAGA